MPTRRATPINGTGTPPENLEAALAASVILARDEPAARFLPVMSMEMALERRRMIVEATNQLMKEGVDYGIIPGSEKPSLLQPGADKLCNLFGLVIEYEITEQVKDWRGEQNRGEPFFYVEVRGYAYRGEVLMGEGIGSCSSMESKYRWRKADRKCPQCGKANIRRSKQKSDGWYCWLKTEGCGSTFREGDPAIESQLTGRVLNPDICDVVNTIQKMAFKRCKVSSTINATSASEFFTQDLEDNPPEPEPTQNARASGGTPAPAAEAASQQPNHTADGSKPGKADKWFFVMLKAFGELKAQIPEQSYYEHLRRYGVHHANEFKVVDRDKAIACYMALKLKVAEYQASFEHFIDEEGGWPQ